MNTSPPPGTVDEEPDYRFTLANERTFLAWMRTALALIAGAVALVQLVPSFGIAGMRHGLAIFVLLVAAYLAVAAVLRWRRVQAAMRQDAPLPPSWLPVGLGMAVLAITVMLFVLIVVWPTVD